MALPEQILTFPITNFFKDIKSPTCKIPPGITIPFLHLGSLIKKIKTERVRRFSVSISSNRSSNPN